MDISELRNSGIGKKCLIFGRGPSAKLLESPTYIYRVKSECNLIVMSVNARSRILKYDYNVYCDMVYHKYVDKSVKQIAPSFLKSDVPDYTFNFDKVGNSGQVALYIAQFIFNFDRIYLIGFDFYNMNGSTHFDEDGVVKDYPFELMMKQFEGILWDYEKIVNLNPFSRLKLFKTPLDFLPYI